ncbi:MAG: HAMP domain-containing sensor histidine kinase [Clostridiaceae bacterium]
MKLGAKLTLIATAVTAAAVLIGILLTTAFAKQNTEKQIAAAGIEDFCAFYNDFSGEAFQADPATLEGRNILRYQFYKTQGFEEYILEQGDLIVSNNTGIDAAGVLAKKGFQEKRTGRFEEPLRYTIAKFGGRDYLFISAEINVLERSHTLSLARDVTRAMDDVRKLTLECALAGAGVILLAAAAVWLLSRRSLKPIGALEQGASEIAAGSYERRISVKGQDEIARLAEQFNHMAEAISEKIRLLSETAERQKLFIGGLSHELKTPVTSILARSETLLLRDISEDDRRRSLERIYEQCAWLERLAAKLMTLTMLEGTVELRLESVQELFDSAESLVADMLKESGMRLEADCKITVLPFDMDLMRSALVNLIENARRASPRGSTIELTAADGVIAVKDYGKGIGREELSRVTEPFYTADRSRSKKNGGSGLGLSLVKRIAEVHHARLEIESEPGAGTRVSLRFLDDDKKITTC